MKLKAERLNDALCMFFFFFLSLKPFPVSQQLIVIQRGGHSEFRASDDSN